MDKINENIIIILIIFISIIIKSLDRNIHKLLNNILFKILILIIISLIYDISPKIALFCIFLYINIIFIDYKTIIREGFIEGLEMDIDSEIASLNDDAQPIMPA